MFGRDDFRHLIAAVVLGERLVPGVNTGNGEPGLIRMSRSSLELTKSDATEAIRMGFDIGNNPEDQGLTCKPVVWCDVIQRMHGKTDDEDDLARRFDP